MHECDAVHVRALDAVRALQEDRDSVRKILECGPGTDTAEHARLLVDNYKRVCGRLQGVVQRRGLGLGGEQVDALVVEELERVAEENETLRKRVDVEYLRGWNDGLAFAREQRGDPECTCGPSPECSEHGSVASVGDREKLRKFAIEILQEYQLEYEGIQDIAVKHGLLAPKRMRPPCEFGDACHCIEYAYDHDKGVVECLRYTALLGKDGAHG
jgi:hypothetical protein